jgi:putative methionine-R-sulfoxide reductase with GAF domain/HAMP domain-containing protein
MLEFFKNFKIRTKLLIGFISISLIIFIIGIRDYTLLIQYDNTKGFYIGNMESIDLIKESKYLIRNEVNTALNIVHSRDNQELEQYWNIHIQSRENFLKGVEKLKEYSKKNFDKEFSSVLKQIGNLTNEIEDDYNGTITNSFNKLRSLKQDLIERPPVQGKKIPTTEEGGIVYGSETDTVTSNSKTTTPIPDDSQEPNEDLNEEEPSDTSKTITPLTPGNEVDLPVSEGIRQVLSSNQDYYNGALNVGDEDIRDKSMYEVNSYIDATGRNIIKRLEATEISAQKLLTRLDENSSNIINESALNTSLLILIGFVISVLIAYLFSKLIYRPIEKVGILIDQLGKGQLPEDILVDSDDELGEITKGLNHLVHVLKVTAQFSIEIGKGNFRSEFSPQSEKDVLGNSLLSMRRSIQEAKEEEQKRKIEDKQRTWATEGLAQFGEILRQGSGNLKILANNIINYIVKYLQSNQGGLFVYNDKDPEDLHLELIAAYAYNRKKYLLKKIKIGEGLIGACALEKYTIYLTEVPDDYIEIESGLGTSNPNCILIVPLKMENNVLGVLELASFNKFEKHEIELIEKITESIASTLATLKINARTADLLSQSQIQASEMHEQEEEMRQTMEMMQATQEESLKREEELKKKLEKLTIEYELQKQKENEQQEEIRYLKEHLNEPNKVEI